MPLKKALTRDEQLESIYTVIEIIAADSKNRKYFTPYPINSITKDRFFKTITNKNRCRINSQNIKFPLSPNPKHPNLN